MRELQQIKKLLKQMNSADIELVIMEATKMLKLKSVEEMFEQMKLASNPKIKQYLEDSK